MPSIAGELKWMVAEIAECPFESFARIRLLLGFRVRQMNVIVLGSSSEILQKA